MNSLTNTDHSEVKRTIIIVFGGTRAYNISEKLHLKSFIQKPRISLSRMKKKTTRDKHYDTVNYYNSTFSSVKIVEGTMAINSEITDSVRLEINAFGSGQLVYDFFIRLFFSTLLN